MRARVGVIAGFGRRLGALATLLSLGTGACQGTNSPSFEGILSLTVRGQNVSGTVPGPCQVDVDFGTVGMGNSAAAIIEIRNLGKAGVDFGSFSPNLDPEFGVNVVGFSSSIAAGASTELSVSFEPFRIGSANSSFSIPTNLSPSNCGGAGSSLIVNLAGSGAQLGLSITPLALDFGSVLVGTTSTLTATLTNTSSVPVSGITAALGGAEPGFFSIQAPSSLDADSSAEVQISYAPLTVPAASQASVSIVAPGGESTGLSLLGSSVNSVLAPVEPIDFGFVPLDTTATGCTTLQDQANLPLNVREVSAIDADGGVFTVSTHDDATPPNPIQFPIAIPPGGSARLCFDFSPLEAAQFGGRAVLATDDPSNARPIVDLTGWGGGPQISCSPISIDFGTTIARSPVVRSVICTNTGTASPASLFLNPPAAEPGVFHASFDQTMHPYPLEGLVPGMSAQIDVSYDPTSSSADQGVLSIPSNGGLGKAVQIPLSGNGLALQPCQVQLSPTAINFGNVPAGGASVQVPFEVQNTGSSECIVQSLAIENDASGSFHVVSANPAPDPDTGWTELPAGATWVVTLQFEPTSTGTFPGEAVFSVSNPSDPDQLVPLVGTSQSTCLAVSPSSLDFGDVGESGAGILCNSAGRTFSVLNTCNTPATLTSIALQSGPGDLLAQFSAPAGMQLPFTLQPGNSGAIYELFFEPTGLGTHTAQILISDGNIDTLLPVSGSAVTTDTETDSFVIGLPRADVLFIVDVDDDPTEQAAIVAQVPDFIAAGASFDYRIAATTDNDYTAIATAEFGQLLPCPNCSLDGPAPTVISPASVPATGGDGGPDPALALQGLLSAVPNNAYPTGGTIDEHFFIALYNALERGPQPSVDFFRPGVFFASITDNSDNEADTSVVGAGDHDPSWYATFFESHFQNQFLFTWNYVNPTQTVTGTGLASYLDLPASIQTMISATNGLAINTEDSNWPAAFDSVWNSAAAAQGYYALTGSPSGGQNGILVTRDGVVLPQKNPEGQLNWEYQSSINAVSVASDVPLVAGDSLDISYPIGCK